MYYILVGILGICLINFVSSKIDSLDKTLLKKNKKLKPLDEKYISILNCFKESLNIKLKTHLLFNPKALEENCRVQILENEIYIIVDKKINEERIKGSIAHELGHVKMQHSKKSKQHMQTLMFLINLCLLTLLLYPLLKFKTYYVVVSIAFFTFMIYLLTFHQYIKRRQELEADSVAVKLMGKEYLKSLNLSEGLIGKLPSFLSDHPSKKERLKNARKIYEAYNKKTINLSKKKLFPVSSMVSGQPLKKR